MEFIARLSLRPETDDAVYDLCVDLKSFQPDLVVVFASHHYGPEFDDLVKGIYDKANARILIGCTGDSIIGPTAEIERQPAVAVWAAKLPDVRIFPFIIDQEDIAGLPDNEAWNDRLGVTAEDDPSFIILPDPFSTNIDAVLGKMDELYPNATIVGGMASGANAPGQNRLFFNNQSLRTGLVGISLTGNVEISSVVSQGCRPIGEPFIITKASENLIEELGGRPALVVLNEIYQAAEAQEQEAMRSGLFVGRLVNEQLSDYGPGDFLIRNLMGVYENRALAVAGVFRTGQTVQFHLRDASSADEEMRRLLGDHHERCANANGALLFSCNGRGRRFFNEANHDISVLNETHTNCPAIGFFAQGEIGPVGGRTFVHGYTSSVILFHEPKNESATGGE